VRVCRKPANISAAFEALETRFSAATEGLYMSTATPLKWRTKTQ
jgi:hypothetical protein